MPIKDEIMHKAVAKMLEEANVPARHHLKLMEVLKKHIDEGNKDRAIWLKVTEKHTKLIAENEAKNKAYDEEIKRLHTLPHIKGEPGKPGSSIKGDPGEPGQDGTSPSIETVVQEVLSRIPMPKNPKGQPLDIGEIILEVIKSLTDSKNPLLTTANLKDITPFTQRLQSAINQNSQGFNFNGKRIKFEELMHGGASNKSTSSSKVSDLSSQCTGSNLIFTIPVFTTILTLMGTDAPIIYRPTVDFTATGTTLTLAGVNAPSRGATLLLTYI